MELSQLAKLPILMRLPEDVLSNVTDKGTIHQVKDGDILQTVDLEADRVIWILKGRVKTTVQEETVIDILSRGAMLGLAEVCEKASNTVSATAIEDTTYFELSRSAFEELYQDHFELQMALFANLSAKMRITVQEINDLKLKNTSRRLGAYLIGMAEQEEGSVDIELTFGKRLLAARLSMKPESLSRALAKLKKVGVESERQKIHIKNIETLKEYCGEEEVML